MTGLLLRRTDCLHVFAFLCACPLPLSSPTGWDQLVQRYGGGPEIVSDGSDSDCHCCLQLQLRDRERREVRSSPSVPIWLASGGSKFEFAHTHARAALTSCVHHPNLTPQLVMIDRNAARRPPEKPEPYFIVHAEWLRQWREWSSGQLPIDRRPGPISNHL